MRFLNADALKLVCELLDIDPFAWWLHFGSMDPNMVTCDVCGDFLADVCPGGTDPKVCLAG